MIDREVFDDLIRKHARAQAVEEHDVLFGGGLDLSSIRFTEFIMELEEATGRDIDIDDLDISIRTVGQLYARLSG